MAIFSIIAIGAALLAGGASYVQAKKAQKKAKKLANSMAGVLLNKESNIEPLPVIYGTRRVGGVRVFISTEGATNEYLYIALALCEGPVASIASIEIDGIPITDSRFSSTVATQLHYGTDDQVRSALLAGASGWTTDHRLRGVAYISVRLKWDQDVFSGIPEITALVTGKRVYDPRTGNTVWSANPALCIRDYLTNTRYGKGLPDSAIDDVAFSAAADDCDSFTVTPYSGATSGIDLFQCNAVIDTGEEIFRNVEKMLLGCRGFLPYIGGKYGLYIDQSKSPILDLGLDNIIGSISFAGERKEDKFNRVIVKFANPNTEWQEDAAIWPDAGSTEETTYLSEDGGVLLVDEIDMETITNYYAARDFARIFVLRSRNGMRVSLQATSEAMNLIVGDVIRLTHPTPSFTNKPFQVEQVSLNYDGTVNLDLLEYDSTIYSYDPASEETSYPDTNLPDPFVVGEPTGLTLTESTRVENDGTIIPAVLVQWSAPVDYFVNAYEVQYKLSTDSTYKSLITWSTEFDLTLPQSGVTYDIRVRSINAVGARSANISDQIAIVGDNVAPGVPTNASVAADTHLLIVTWDNPSDSDFSYTEIKRSPNATEANAVVIAKINGEAYTDGPFAVGTTYYYWLRAVDRTGNASEWVSAGNDTTVALAAGDLEGDLVNTGLYRGIVTDDANAPSNAEFSSVAGRNPRDGDLAITIDTTADPDVYYAWEYDGDSWDSIPNLISGDLLVDGSVSASKIDVTGVITAGSLITESATISNDIQIGSGESVFKADSNGIYLGNETFANAEFRVTPAGAVTATSATISGSVTASSFTLSSGATLSDADNQITNSANKGKTIALLLNKDSDGTANTGEGSLVGVNNEGEVVLETDGFFIWNGTKYVVDRDQISTHTFRTNVAGKKGYLAYDLSGANFTVSGVAIQAAFVWKEGGIWYYDNNSSGVSFTPTNSMLALAYIETGAADVIQRGGLLAEPVQLLTLSEIVADYISAGTIDASVVNVTNLTADNITAGTIDADRLSVDGVTIDTNGTGQLIIKDGGVDSTQLADGAVTAGKIGDGEVSITKFASGITAIQVVDELPGTATQGDQAFLTTDNKLYRYNGTAWVASIPLADVTGTGALAALDDITLAKVTDSGALASRDDVTLSLVTDAGTLAALDSVAETNIDADAITETKIKDDEISTDKLKANAVTAAKIAANTITAAQIAAGAIVTSKLAVTARGAALNSDPNMQDSSAWSLFDGNAGTFEEITDGVVGNNVLRSGTPGSTGSWYNGSEKLALDPSKTYRMTGLARKSATADGVLYLGVAAFDDSGNNISGDGTQWSYDAASNDSGSTDWTRYTMEFGAGTAQTFPANAVTFSPIVILNYASTAGYFEAQDVRIEEKINSSLIVDGAVITDKLAANAVTAAKIAANTITANEILGNTITANEIAAGTITAAEIAAATITGAKIAANTIAAANIAANTITSSEIAANTITAGQIAAGAIGADEIAANAVTADKISVTNLAAITADLGTVTAGSLSAGLITGDVNENFPFWTADEAYLNTTDTSFTMVEMTTPAPSGGVSKRPSFDAHLNYQNRDVSARAEVIMRIQVKAESATGVSLGAIATVQDGIGEDSGSIVYKWYGISGNHLDKLGVGGEISTSADGSTSTSTVQGVKYDGTYTYVLVDTDLDYSYSVGNTLYYSWTSFNSVGTFSTVATVFSSTVGETGFQENSMSVSVHGPKTTTGKDFRMTFSRVSGTTLHLLTTGSAGYIR